MPDSHTQLQKDACPSLYDFESKNILQFIL